MGPPLMFPSTAREALLGPSEPERIEDWTASALRAMFCQQQNDTIMGAEPRCEKDGGWKHKILHVLIKSDNFHKERTRCWRNENATHLCLYSRHGWYKANHYSSRQAEGNGELMKVHGWCCVCFESISVPGKIYVNGGAQVFSNQFSYKIFPSFERWPD